VLDLILCLSSLKTLCWFFPHSKLSPLDIMAWSGVAIVEKDVMNFYRYCDTSTNPLASMTLVGTSHLRMASIFVGSILSSPPPITCPKYTNDYWENSHFLRLASSWFFFKVSNTFMRCEMHSSKVNLYTNISSKYTITNESRKGCDTSFIEHINVVGSLHKPKGILPVIHIDLSFS